AGYFTAAVASPDFCTGLGPGYSLWEIPISANHWLGVARSCVALAECRPRCRSLWCRGCHHEVDWGRQTDATRTNHQQLGRLSLCDRLPGSFHRSVRRGVCVSRRALLRVAKARGVRPRWLCDVGIIYFDSRPAVLAKYWRAGCGWSA